MLRGPLFVVLAALLGVAAFAAAACGARANRGDDGSGPVSTAPSQPTLPAESALHAARLDLAGRLRVDPLDVHLRRLQHAGWDGCLGVKEEGEACTMIFIGGFIAWFEAAGKEYRYHLGGDRFVAASFATGTLEDGSPVPPDVRADFGAILADYAAWDLSLRTGTPRSDLVTTLIAPVTFPDLCLGFVRPEAACGEMPAPGFIVELEAGGEPYRYHVSAYGFIATDFEQGRRTVEPPSDHVAVQRAMREDLATRLGTDPDRVSVYSFRLVTWRDGCLGVHRPGEVCTQALVDGFLAELAAPGGRLFRYHGVGDHFVAASFEEAAGASLQEPIFPEE
jgi:hypothetical protein